MESLRHIVIHKIIEISNQQQLLNFLSSYGHTLTPSQLKQITNKVVLYANSSHLNNILNRFGRMLSPNNYMKLENARRIRKISNSNIQKELKTIEKRLRENVRPNNTVTRGIIQKRKNNLEKELKRRNLT